MKQLLSFLLLFTLMGHFTIAQTPLTTAPNFNVKTVDGAVIELYPLLDAGKVVVLDFFSVSCGPCQLYAPHFQGAFEAFGRNLGNVFFLGINYNGTNADVIFFDSLFGLTFPSASGLDGGGNAAFHLFQLSAYPTVLVIRPDKVITSPYVWPPTTDNIINAVTFAGGTLVGFNEFHGEADFIVTPNPVVQGATIQLLLNQKEALTIDLLDTSGRLIKRLMKHEMFDAGQHRINFSAEDLPNGIFFVAFTTERKRVLKKITVVNH